MQGSNNKVEIQGLDVEKRSEMQFKPVLCSVVVGVRILVAPLQQECVSGTGDARRRTAGRSGTIHTAAKSRGGSTWKEEAMQAMR